jgi:hypothetical protein
MADNDRTRRQEAIKRVRSELKVSQITCSKTVRGTTVTLTGELQESLGFSESRIAAHLLGLHVNKLTIEQAYAEGVLSEIAARDQLMSAERAYAQLLMEEIELSGRNK